MAKLLFRVLKDGGIPFVLTPDEWASTETPYDSIMVYEFGASYMCDDTFIKRETRPARTIGERAACLKIAGKWLNKSPTAEEIQYRFSMSKSRYSRKLSYWRDRPEKRPVWSIKQETE